MTLQPVGISVPWAWQWHLLADPSKNDSYTSKTIPRPIDIWIIVHWSDKYFPPIQNAFGFITEEDLLPLKTVKFNGVDIVVPNKVNICTIRIRIRIRNSFNSSIKVEITVKQSYDNMYLK